MVDLKTEERLNAAIELLHFAYRAMIARADQLLARRGLGRLHHRILYFVARRPGTSVSALIRTLGVSKQAINAPLRQLVAQELVVQSPSAADRRIRQLDLTPAGRRLEARLSALQREQFAQTFHALGPEAEQAWRETMRHFAEAEMRKAGRWEEVQPASHGAPNT